MDLLTLTDFSEIKLNQIYAPRLLLNMLIYQTV